MVRMKFANNVNIGSTAIMLPKNFKPGMIFSGPVHPACQTRWKLQAL